MTWTIWNHFFSFSLIKYKKYFWMGLINVNRKSCLLRLTIRNWNKGQLFISKFHQNNFYWSKYITAGFFSPFQMIDCHQKAKTKTILFLIYLTNRLKSIFSEDFTKSINMFSLENNRLKVTIIQEFFKKILSDG